jgi:hypothetical protein
VAPVFFDPHVYSPPSTADLIGREMDFECGCGRRWRLENYLREGRLRSSGGRGFCCKEFGHQFRNDRIPRKLNGLS